LPRLQWTMFLLFYPSHRHWYDRHAPPCTAFFHWDGASQTVFACWPETTTLPTSYWLRWVLVNFWPGQVLNYNPLDLRKHIFQSSMSFILYSVGNWLKILPLWGISFTKLKHSFAL
jgi:hypothetical protein